MQLTREGAVYLLTLTNGELANTLTADVLGEYEANLDELEVATGNAALAAKIVSAIHPAESLFPKALELAEALSRKDRDTYTSIKRGMKRHLVKLQKKLQEKKIF